MHLLSEKIQMVGECWIWMGSVTKLGYGQFKIGDVSYSAHRAAYQLHKGEIPSGASVCHTCDNRACINPQHLFTASNQLNMRDCAEKGRSRNGATGRGVCMRGHLLPTASVTCAHCSSDDLMRAQQKNLTPPFLPQQLPMETPPTPTMRELMPAGFIKELARRTGCKSASMLSGVISLENTGSRLWPAVEKLAEETNPDGFAAWQTAHAQAA
ncbi:HNH endonuclease signature motif containing protein [Hymenobacter sp. UYP22]|uniref:HNH endonuclease signature motif containing protein n=1 Tax=Hymenobacter sp. UYP22 TaxID=3156348 RepID=UPI00339695A7